jgi:hypothetical protein
MAAQHVLRRLMCDSRPSRDVRPVERALSAAGECIELLGLRHLTHALTIPISVRSTNCLISGQSDVSSKPQAFVVDAAEAHRLTASAQGAASAMAIAR